MSQASVIPYHSGNTTGSPQPPETMQVPLQARGLYKSFQMGEASFTVLRGLDFDLQPGEFVAIEGRSGSGKSTLLHILAALDTADAGSVIFNHQDHTNRTPPPPAVWLRVLTIRPDSGWADVASRWGPAILFGLAVVGLLLSQILESSPAVHLLEKVSLIVAAVVLALWVVRLLVFCLAKVGQITRDGPAARLRNTEFGFIFQFYHLLPELNVLENTMLAPSIELGWLGYLLRKKELRQRAMDLLTRLGMGHRLNHRPGQLSGGERQRVAIARALMNSPKVLFADEPTGNLDAETGRQIMDLLEALHRERGQTIVMVTHDRSLAREADRVLVLKDGTLHPAT